MKRPAALPVSPAHVRPDSICKGKDKEIARWSNPF